MDKSGFGRIAGAALALVATAGIAIVAVTSAVGAGSAVPTPTPAAVVETIDFASLPYTNGLAGEQETDAAAAVAAQQARVAAEAAAAAEVARVAAEQAAAVEAERIAAEQQLEAEIDEPDAPSGATKCPAGSLPNSGDGENHTSCFPEECFHVTLPDPSYPQCVTAFKP
ncbi:hypothetical protein [Agromyces subbeticus]|uniref:hypothetical protein n=1 Tax=Agromyces subbeticus TaxID=293890 RepID=UPI0003B6FF20|nr:hypothetical protein [Agromyces subbeticus]